jgi:hypothetical protein
MSLALVIIMPIILISRRYYKNYKRRKKAEKEKIETLTPQQTVKMFKRML